LYSSTIIIRITKSSRIRRVVYAAHMGRKEMHIMFWFGNPEGKRALGRCIRRWEDNIKTDLSELVLEGVD
jgi:hypothetical protein